MASASTSKPAVLQADLAVVGAGAAGLYAALCAAQAGARVLLVSATPLAQTASYWAQGGLAAALAVDDSPERHLADTERAGRELVRRSAAEVLVREAPDRVADLQRLGVRFDADRYGRLALGLEGGHSIRRIVHAGGSATGRRLVRQLSALVAESSRIAVLEGARARALWTDAGAAEAGTTEAGATEAGAMEAGAMKAEATERSATETGARCRGLVCEFLNGSIQRANSSARRVESSKTRANDSAQRAGSATESAQPLNDFAQQREQRELGVIGARAVVLATGGMAALWSRTTNPPGSQGVGLMLAHAAGAKLADLELLQFHPTAVIGVPGREGFLVTEAIRGEGATLHDLQSGERFVDELAPRDEVSRAIQARLGATGASAVGLDMRSIDPALFPNVVAALREAGLDPTRELVPVAPAAHYAMGGIAVDLDSHSTLDGLYAVGEVSCTGLHGANRLASNSLSECFVFARRAVAAALSGPPAGSSPSATELEALVRLPAPALATPATRSAVWQDAGVERDEHGLTRLLSDPHPLARLIAGCALARAESRGAHLRIDYPDRDPALDRRHAVLAADTQVQWETWT